MFSSASPFVRSFDHRRGRLLFCYSNSLCEGCLGCKILLMSSGCQELLLLQLRAPGCRLPVCRSSNRQAFKLGARVSCKVSSTCSCHPEWYRIGYWAASVRSPQRRSASRGDSSESSSEEGTQGKKDEEDIPANEGVNMDVKDDLEDDDMEPVDEPVKLKDESERFWFWRGWWPSGGKNQIADVADDKDQEELEKLGNKAVVEAQGSELNDGEIKSEKSGGESEEGQEKSGESDRGEETASSEEIVQTEEANVGFWRRIWKQEVTVDDELLGPEEELLLKDLESLTFNWKELFDPTLENILALGFTALLTLALFKILWQLVTVVITILFSALKYTVLAGFLVGLLIFLL